VITNGTTQTALASANIAMTEAKECPSRIVTKFINRFLFNETSLTAKHTLPVKTQA
jgi:hypothetical protein